MKLRRRRRHLVVFSSSVVPAGQYETPALARTGRKAGVRRLIRIGGLLTVISMMGVIRVTRRRRRLLTLLVLTALPVILRDSLWGLVFFLVFMLYLSALVTADT